MCSHVQGDKSALEAALVEAQSKLQGMSVGEGEKAALEAQLATLTTFVPLSFCALCISSPFQCVQSVEDGSRQVQGVG